MTQLPGRKLRVGIAGLGFGAAVHAPAILAFPDVELIGIAGRDKKRAQKTASSLGIPHGCGSIDELLELKLDAITLALPPDQAAVAVRKSLQAGTAVLCEKPLGTDAQEARELAQTGTSHITAMDFIFAELETFQRLKALIDSNTYGAIRHAHITWLTESRAYREKIWSWKTDAQQGGGAISLFGSHLFYLMEWLIGPITTIQARTGVPMARHFAPPNAEPAEDLVYCWTTHENSCFTSATFGNANPGSHVHRWTVVCDQGTIVLENTTSDYIAGFVLTVYNHSGAGEILREPHMNGDGRLQPFSKLARRFLNGVHTKQPTFPNLAAGARVQLIDSLVRESISHKNSLQVPSGQHG